MNSDDEDRPFYCDNDKFEQNQVRKLQNQRETLQAKTYRNWINSILIQDRTQIDDFYPDLSDGIQLIRVLELITGESIAKPDHGSLKVHKLQNATHLLKFIKNKEIYLESIGPEDIVDENHRLVLGLVWTIILRFHLGKHIQDDNAELSIKTVKDSLLCWVQSKIPNGGVVRDFHRSWSTGWSFVELVRSFREDVIEQERLEQLDDVQRLKTAFELADKHLNIPKILDAEDVAESPDENSILTYVSYFHNLYCKTKSNETNHKRIKHAIEVSSSIQNIKDNYLMEAECLRDKIRQQCQIFDQGFPLTDAQNERTKFDEYFSSTREELLKHRNRCEMLYTEIRAEQKLNSFLKFVPTNGLSVNDIECWWKDLQALEKKREDKIVESLQRQQTLQIKMECFESKSLKIESYISEMVDTLNHYITVLYSTKPLDECQTRLRQLDILCSTILRQNDKHHSDFFKLTDELVSNRVGNYVYVQTCQRHIRTKLDKLHQMAANNHNQVQESYTFLSLIERLDCLRQEVNHLHDNVFASSIEPFQPAHKVFVNIETVRQHRTDLEVLQKQCELIKTQAYIFFDNNNKTPQILFDTSDFHTLLDNTSTKLENCVHRLTSNWSACTFNLKWNEFQNDIHFYEQFFNEKYNLCLSKKDELLDRSSLLKTQRRNNIFKLELKTIEKEFYETCSKGFTLANKCPDYAVNIKRSVENVKNRLKQIIQIVNERTLLINDTMKLIKITSQCRNICEQINDQTNIPTWLYESFSGQCLHEQEFIEFGRSLEVIDNLSIGHSEYSLDSDNTVNITFLKGYTLEQLNLDESHAYLLIKLDVNPFRNLDNAEKKLVKLVSNNYETAQKLFAFTAFDFDSEQMRKSLLENVENDLKVGSLDSDNFVFDCEELEQIIDLYFSHNNTQQFLEILHKRKNILDSDVCNIRSLIHSVRNAMRLFKITNSVTNSIQRIAQHEQKVEQTQIHQNELPDENRQSSSTLEERLSSRQTKAKAVLERMQRAMDVMRQYFDEQPHNLRHLQDSVEVSKKLVLDNLTELEEFEEPSETINIAKNELRRLSQTQECTEQSIIFAQTLSQHEELLLLLTERTRMIQHDPTISVKQLTELRHSTSQMFDNVREQFDKQSSQSSMNAEILAKRRTTLLEIYERFVELCSKKALQIERSNMLADETIVKSDGSHEHVGSEDLWNLSNSKSNIDDLDIADEIIESLLDDLHYGPENVTQDRMDEKLAIVQNILDSSEHEPNDERFKQLQDMIEKSKQIWKQKIMHDEAESFRKASQSFVESCRKLKEMLNNHSPTNDIDSLLEKNLQVLCLENRALKDAFGQSRCGEIQSKLIFCQDLLAECRSEAVLAHQNTLAWAEAHKEIEQIQKCIDKYLSTEFKEFGVFVNGFRTISGRIDQIQNSFVPVEAGLAFEGDINLLTHKLLKPINKRLLSLFNNELATIYDSYSEPSADSQSRADAIEQCCTIVADLDRIQRSLPSESISVQVHGKIRSNYGVLLVGLNNILNHFRQANEQTGLPSRQDPKYVQTLSSVSLNSPSGSSTIECLSNALTKSDSCHLPSVNDNLHDSRPENMSVDTAFSYDKTTPVSALSDDNIHNLVLLSECDSGHFDDSAHNLTATLDQTDEHLISRFDSDLDAIEGRVDAVIDSIEDLKNILVRHYEIDHCSGEPFTEPIDTNSQIEFGFENSISSGQSLSSDRTAYDDIRPDDLCVWSSDSVDEESPPGESGIGSVPSPTSDMPMYLEQYPPTQSNAVPDEMSSRELFAMKSVEPSTNHETSADTSRTNILHSNSVKCLPEICPNDHHPGMQSEPSSTGHRTNTKVDTVFCEPIKTTTSSHAEELPDFDKHDEKDGKQAKQEEEEEEEEETPESISELSNQVESPSATQKDETTCLLIQTQSDDLFDFEQNISSLPGQTLCPDRIDADKQSKQPTNDEHNEKVERQRRFSEQNQEIIDDLERRLEDVVFRMKIIRDFLQQYYANQSQSENSKVISDEKNLFDKEYSKDDNTDDEAEAATEGASYSDIGNDEIEEAIEYRIETIKAWTEEPNESVTDYVTNIRASGAELGNDEFESPIGSATESIQSTETIAKDNANQVDSGMTFLYKNELHHPEIELNEISVNITNEQNFQKTDNNSSGYANQFAQKTHQKVGVYGSLENTAGVSLLPTEVGPNSGETFVQHDDDDDDDGTHENDGTQDEGHNGENNENSDLFSNQTEYSQIQKCEPALESRDSECLKVSNQDGIVDTDTLKHPHKVIVECIPTDTEQLSSGNNCEHDPSVESNNRQSADRSVNNSTTNQPKLDSFLFETFRDVPVNDESDGEKVIYSNEINARPTEREGSLKMNYLDNNKTGGNTHCVDPTCFNCSFHSRPDTQNTLFDPNEHDGSSETPILGPGKNDCFVENTVTTYFDTQDHASAIAHSLIDANSDGKHSDSLVNDDDEDDFKAYFVEQEIKIVEQERNDEESEKKNQKVSDDAQNVTEKNEFQHPSPVSLSPVLACEANEFSTFVPSSDVGPSKMMPGELECQQIDNCKPLEHFAGNELAVSEHPDCLNKYGQGGRPKAEQSLEKQLKTSSSEQSKRRKNRKRRKHHKKNQKDSIVNDASESGAIISGDACDSSLVNNKRPSVGTNSESIYDEHFMQNDQTDARPKEQEEEKEEEGARISVDRIRDEMTIISSVPFDKTPTLNNTDNETVRDQLTGHCVPDTVDECNNIQNNSTPIPAGELSAGCAQNGPTGPVIGSETVAIVVSPTPIVTANSASQIMPEWLPASFLTEPTLAEVDLANGNGNKKQFISHTVPEDETESDSGTAKLWQNSGETMENSLNDSLTMNLRRSVESNIDLTTTDDKHSNATDDNAHIIEDTGLLGKQHQSSSLPSNSRRRKRAAKQSKLDKLDDESNRKLQVQQQQQQTQNKQPTELFGQAGQDTDHGQNPLDKDNINQPSDSDNEEPKEEEPEEEEEHRNEDVPARISPLSRSLLRRIFQTIIGLYLLLALLLTLLGLWIPSDENQWNCLAYIDQYRRGLVRIFSDGSPPV